MDANPICVDLEHNLSFQIKINHVVFWGDNDNSDSHQIFNNMGFEQNIFRFKYFWQHSTPHRLEAKKIKEIMTVSIIG